MKNLTILIFLVSIVPCLVYAQTIHVPANYSTIQEGIDAAIHGDTVLVDTGTYIERINFTGKNITVASKYLVTEDTSYISKTIIDGDSLGSVVTITSGEDSTTMLYGFTVQNGADSVGGGIRVIGSNPEIVHNVVKNNTVTHAGGGIYLLNADVKILYTKVSDNNIYPGENTGKGGGIHISGSNPIIHNSIITSNIIHKNNNIWNHLYGGGLFIDLSGGEVRNSVISNNSVLYQYGSGAAWGGGLYINRSNTLISDLIISGNLSRLHGGGISVHTNNVKLINLQIEDNTATFGAGVLDKGGVHIYNSIITQNNGTGIATYNTTRLINCTVIGNLGGGFYMLTYDKMVTTTLYNSILRDNGNYDICGGGDENGRDHIRLSFCNVDEDRICTKYIDVTWLSGNINMDPLFESQFGFPYYLSNESSSINAGRPDTSGFHLPETDIAGNPRLYGTSIDIGAIENQEVRGIIHVPQDYFTIQAAIDAAYDGEMVLVDTGTYVERINFIGKNITVASKYITTQDTNYISQTIIDGDSLGAVVTIGNVEDTTTLLQGFTIQNGTGEKGGGLFIDGADPRIEYCVIKNNTSSKYGAGIYLVNSETGISKSRIEGNKIFPLTDHSAGGGIYCYNSDPIIDSVSITQNIIHKSTDDCSSSGGGIMIFQCGGSLTNSRILNNSIFRTNKPAWGGGLACGSGTTTYRHLYFEGNYSESYGGGISCSSNTFENIHLVGNSAIEGGGLYNAGYTSIYNAIITDNTGDGIYTLGGQIRLYNSTIVDNEGIGLFVGLSRAYVYNSIFWNNSGFEISGGSEKENFARAYLYHNNIEPGGVVDNQNWLHVFWEGGNIEEDPLFEEHFGFAYYPSNKSPCVNAGIADATELGLPETDIAGNTRIFGNRIDIGAMENQEMWLGTPNPINSEIGLILNPNPVSEKLLIEFELTDTEMVDISIMDINGHQRKQILSKSSSKGTNHFIIDCERLEAGVYLLRLECNGKTTVRRFVKL